MARRAPPPLAGCGLFIVALLLALIHPSPARAQKVPICPESTGPGEIAPATTESTGQGGVAPTAVVTECPGEPVYRAPPSVSLEPHHQDYLNPSLCEGCFDAVVKYSTPAYTSLDKERQLTLMFANAQARPTGFVQVDATDNSSGDWPVRMSIRVRTSGGTWVTFTNGLQEVFYEVGWGGTYRLAAQWDASGMATGAHSYTAVIRSYWADGGYLETSVPVRVMIVNERGSPYGLGWSMAGVQRLYPQAGGGAVITDGEGAAVHFRYNYCSSDPYSGIYSCSYIQPAGDFSTLSYISYAGTTVYSRSYPDGTMVSFDAGGLQTSVQDRHGNTTYFGYTGGRLTSVTDPAGLVTTLGYHASGALAWIRDPAGRQVNTVASGNILFHFVDPDGVVGLDMHFAGDRLDGYWPRGQARAAGDAARYHFDYDGARRLAATTMPTVNVDGQPSRPVVRFVSLESAVLAPAGLGTHASPAPGQWGGGVRARVIDAQNNTTWLALDRFGAPTRVDEPLGRTTVLTRNTHSQVVDRTSPSGRRVEYRWSGPNLIREVDHSIGRVDTMAYNSNRLSARWTRTLSGNVLWPAVAYHYRGNYLDSMTVYSGSFGTVGGYLAFQPGGGAKYATYQMDNRGRVTAVTDGSGFTTRFYFAPNGWMNTDSVVAPGARKTSYAYDGYGRVRVLVDALGRADTMDYDVMNRMRRVARPGGRITRLDYGPVHLTTVTDAKNQVYQYSTNVLGWRESETDPLGGQQLYFYDARGNLVRSRNRRGSFVQFTYDALNQLRTRTADGVTTQYYSDPYQRFRTAEVPGVSTDTIRYDPRGRVTNQIAVHGGRRHELASSYGYFAHDYRSSVTMTAPWSRTMHYNTYTTGQLYQLTDPAGGKTRVGYDARRLATSYTLPTGDIVNVRYPSTGQAAYVSHNTAPLDVAFGVYYKQDQMVRTASRSNALGDSLREMSYDALGQLSGYTDYRVTHSMGNCGWNWDPLTGADCPLETSRTPLAQASYTYDAVGNRTDRGGVTAVGNRMTSFDGYTLVYDADGNVTRKYLTGNMGAFDQHLTWNSLGQLVSVTTNSQTVTYAYNGWGELIRRSDAGGTVRYVYDGENLFMETVDGWSEPHRVYAHYLGVDQPHSVQVWTPGAAAQTYYFATDYPGNVLGLFNGSNQVVNRYRYDPWGRAELASEQIGNPLRYAGRYRDWGSGLDYNRNRWYDSHTGRFLSLDPLGLDGGLNPYVYAGNQPVDFSDPYGLWRVPRWVPVVAFIVTAAMGVSGGMSVGQAVWGTTQAFAASAVGSAMAAGLESWVSGKSFEDTFFRNWGYSTAFLAGGAVVADIWGGGVTEIGANGWYQGYIRTANPIRIRGGLTIGSAAVFSGAGREDGIPGGTLGQHERGHTAQFILLSAQGKNPWGAYLLLGALGTTKAGTWWEDGALQGGRF